MFYLLKKNLFLIIYFHGKHWAKIKFTFLIKTTFFNSNAGCICTQVYQECNSLAVQVTKNYHKAGNNEIRTVLISC